MANKRKHLKQHGRSNIARHVDANYGRDRVKLTGGGDGLSIDLTDKPKPKRAPSLADIFIQRSAPEQRSANMKRFFYPQTLDHIRGLMRSAVRFRLDDAGTRHLGRIIRDIPEAIADNVEFAVPPYETMWIEYNPRTIYEAVNGEDASRTSDDMLGFLIHGQHAYQIVNGQDERVDDVLLCPIRFLLHTDFSEHQRVEFMRERVEISGSDEQVLSTYDQVLWGSSVVHAPHASWRSASQCFGIEAIDNPVAQLLKKATAQSNGQAVPNALQLLLLTGIPGDLRTLVSLLLLLDQPSKIKVVEELPHFRGFMGNKLRPYLSHSVITLALEDKEVLLRRARLLGPASERRRHKVRGHFCHDDVYHRNTGCVHEWVRYDWETNTLDSEKQHWVCQKCFGKRWWRARFMRGSALKGFVTSEYEVV